MIRFTKSEVIMLGLALASLIFAEFMWFSGETKAAVFIGLWVPSILGFAIYLKLIKLDNK